MRGCKVENGVLTEYYGREDTIVISDLVTAIGEHAFEGCYINSVYIPDTVTSIGKNAFKDCRKLTIVHIPKGVTHYWEGSV